jgi:hypothetical protein
VQNGGYVRGSTSAVVFKPGDVSEALMKAVVERKESDPGDRRSERENICGEDRGTEETFELTYGEDDP